ncbi:hypothetical protein EDB85DRAFT_2151911 [Lactarius pseudohatsudake]|nr:hypothetical protein EDB85DRAFT_2151911 [Lactarius pseudohatsudake]
MPPRTILCPNCKRAGHTVEFCVAQGGKMEGVPMFEAISRQRAAQDAWRQRTRPQGDGTPYAGPTPAMPGPSSALRVDDDGSLWIGGIRYRPDGKTTAAIAEATEATADTPDQGEFPDWAPTNSADTLLDTDTMLIASVEHDTALFSHPSTIPFFLDSGASSHISCLRSDFGAITQLSEPRKISGVGNASVYAVGVGTIDILLPGPNVRLQLHDVLFAPDANVRLVSIHQLNHLGYVAQQCTQLTGMVFSPLSRLRDYSGGEGAQVSKRVNVYSPPSPWEDIYTLWSYPDHLRKSDEYRRPQYRVFTHA